MRFRFLTALAVVAEGLFGLLLVFFVVWHILEGFRGGFTASWWVTSGFLAILWGLPHVLVFLTQPRITPVPAVLADTEPHKGLVRSYAEAGYTEWSAWKLRRGAQGLLFAFRRPHGRHLIHLFFGNTTSQAFIVSSLNDGAGWFSTATNGAGLVLFEELRQIIATTDIEKLVAHHEAGLKYLESNGVSISAVDVDSAASEIARERQLARAILWTPHAFLGSMIRPLLHSGRIDRRIGRYWQLRRFQRSGS